MADVSLTWLGHGSFRIDTPGDKRIYLDPWLGNPKCPESEKDPERIDVIAVTHGHGDHVGDTVELAKRFSPEIVAQVELKGWLGAQGAPVGDMPGPNKGGTVEAAVALELLGVRRCVPAHYGTFPALTGTPDELRQLAPDVEITAPQPGETVTLGKMVTV